MQKWAFLEGIDSVCNSIEEILTNQNRFCIVHKFDYLIFDFQFSSINNKNTFFVFSFNVRIFRRRFFIRTNNSYLCIKGIIRRLWHEGMFKARGTRAFKFPRAIIDNYARGTYNVLFYFIISKRFKQIFSFP
jgi:hypothetical protein